VKSGAASPTAKCPPRAEFQSGLNGKIMIAGMGTRAIIAPNRSGGWHMAQ